MSGEILFVIVDPEALVTLVSIHGISGLDQWPFVDIEKMTLERLFCFPTEFT